MTKSELYKKTINISAITEKMIFCIRRQNHNRADRYMKSWTPLFSDVITDVLTDREYYSDCSVNAEESFITDMLSCVMKAQEMGDYILLADCMELDVLPFINSVMNALCAHSDVEVFDFFAGNLSLLDISSADKACLENAYNAINSCADNYSLGGKTYILESTILGQITLNVDSNGKLISFHSRKSPLHEASEMISAYYDEYARGYNVFGLGLGYHVLELCEMCKDNVDVDVYESDINVLALALTLSDFSPHLKRRLKIHYDPDCMKFASAAKTEGRTIIIHHPSLMNIANDDIRTSMNELFVQDSSVRNQLGDMMSNFYNNTVNCTHYVDEIADSIRGRDVIIAGAGPSLDMNFECLAGKREDPVLIVVGTALRKFVKAGINPDYAIFLDSSDRIYSQISGMENGDFKVLLSATACSRISERFAGDKYLICQQGVDEAVEYATSRNYLTYESGGSVSTLAFDVAVRLGAGRVILIGMDLAYTDNKVHATNANYKVLTDTTGLVQVKGRDNEMLYTTPAMSIYRKWFERSAYEYKQSLKDKCPIFINATGGGAYIDGFEYRKLEEVLNGTV